MAITEDASTPASVQSVTTTAATATFSPPANTLLVACCAFGSSGSGTTTGAITDTSLNAWTLGIRTNVSGDGSAEIWYFYLNSAPATLVVTATGTSSTAPTLLSVRVLNGAKSSQAGAATSTSSTTTPSSSITTTTTGSWVYGALMDNASNATLTVAAGTTTISLFQDASDGEVAATYKATSATGTPGSTSFGYTSATSNTYLKSLFEVLPAASTTIPNRVIVPSRVPVIRAATR